MPLVRRLDKMFSSNEPQNQPSPTTGGGGVLSKLLVLVLIKESAIMHVFRKVRELIIIIIIN